MASDEIPDQIRKLSELRDSGILTNEEFEAKKRDLLARWGPPAPPAQPPPPLIPSGPSPSSPPDKKKPWFRTGWGILAIVVGLIVVGVALNDRDDSPSTGSRRTPSPEANGQAAGGGGGGPVSAQIGQPVLVDGLEITIQEASYASSLEFQEPAAGHVYVAYKLSLTAVDGDQLVSLGDFEAAADGTNQGSWTIVITDQWEPTLAFEDIAEGNTRTGWITFEVPMPDDYVLLTYSDGLFDNEIDLQLRTRCCG